jgi:hypothetical protein
MSSLLPVQYNIFEDVEIRNIERVHYKLNVIIFFIKSYQNDLSIPRHLFPP